MNASLPEPLTFKSRIEWTARTATSPQRLAGYAISSAMATATNSPEEYGPHWDGFGRRVGLRLSTGATGLAMESAVGALWGEDPRYVRATGRPVQVRLWNIAKMSLLARDETGRVIAAYARYIAIPANSYLSNEWRPDSQTSTGQTLGRIPLAFVDRMIANSFSEFWPDIKKRLKFRR